MLDRIEQLLSEARERLEAAAKSAEVEALRVRYLGRKGEIAAILGEIPKLSNDMKRQVGRAANQAKREITALVKAATERAAATGEAPAARVRFDPTLPGLPPRVGAIHPLVQTVREMTRILAQLGFSVATGPEVELEWYNFEALNIPRDHPARDDFDTFYVGDDVLLRSQTSTVQIRTMEKTQPPVRIIAPGRVFRPETEDARHASMFHQIEGLMVDEGVSFADLKAVLHLFAREFFERDLKTRFRPSFFPFTEPSAEMDVSCPMCGSSGCSVCGYSGWLELGGCGMVDPNVFEAVGYDPERYTGFAFGMGIDRFAMIKYRIDNIRLFVQGDVRFLAQFA
jgi:phenylalanyl-tRNA synthetase alpha chain